MNWNDILERAIWTFLQAFATAWVAIERVSDVEGWVSAADMALAAAVGAVISFVKTVAQERLAIPDTRTPLE